jgi:hypothetical protein
MEIHEDKIIMRAGKYDLPKPWQSLTEGEIMAALLKVDLLAVRLPPGLLAFARELDAKLKEKNDANRPADI